MSLAISRSDQVEIATAGYGRVIVRIKAGIQSLELSLRHDELEGLAAKLETARVVAKTYDPYSRETMTEKNVHVVAVACTGEGAKTRQPFAEANFALRHPRRKVW